MAHGVAVQEELARHAVHASLQAQIRVEGLHQIGVALVGRERSEDLIGERADLARRLTEDEAVRTQVVEVRGVPDAAVRSSKAKCLLRLDEREVRARRPGLRTRDARGELGVGDLGGDPRAQPLPFAARVDRRGRRDGGAQLRGRPGVAACERDRQVPRVARTCPLNRKSLPFWEAFGSSLVRCG